ncbi:MAG: hypothetical protein ABR596_02635 [Halarsenatibacteraceae bacterium]
MSREESEARGYIDDFIDNELDRKIYKMQKKLNQPIEEYYYEPVNMSPSLGGVYDENSLPGDPTGNQAAEIADLNYTRSRFIELFQRIKQEIQDYMQQNNMTKQQLHRRPDDLIQSIADIIDPDREKEEEKMLFLERMERERQETKELLAFFSL